MLAAGSVCGQLWADEGQLVGRGEMLLFSCVRAAWPSLEVSGESKNIRALTDVTAQGRTLTVMPP